MRGPDGTSAGPSLGVRLGRLAASIVAILIGATALAGLGVGAVHGVRGTADLDTNRQAARWTVDAEYWDCLDTQARSLIKPGERVWLDTTDIVTLVALEKLLGPWAVLESTRRRAQVYIGLATRHGPGACLGSVVVGRFPRPGRSGTVERIGSGASLPGSPQQLPSTPL